MIPRRGIAVSCGRVFLGYTHGDWREASRLGHWWQKQRRLTGPLTFREIR